MHANIQQLSVRASPWQPCQDLSIFMYEMSPWERLLYLYRVPSMSKTKKYSLQVKSILYSFKSSFLSFL